MRVYEPHTENRRAAGRMRLIQREPPENAEADARWLV